MSKAKLKQTARTNQKVVKNKLSDVCQNAFEETLNLSRNQCLKCSYCKQYQNSDKPKRKRKSLTKRERKL